MIPEYLECLDCHAVARTAVVRHNFEGKCPLCDGQNFKGLSQQEADQIHRDVVVLERLTKREWRTKWCEICGAAADLRIMDAEGHELAYRCLEHKPTKDDNFVERMMQKQKEATE